MEDYHSSRIVDHDELDGLSLPGEVQLALDDLAGSVREGLLALSVGVGLRVMDELVEEELRALVGPKGKHDPGRTAIRHGSRPGQVVLGGRKVRVRRPRARSLEGHELPLRAYARFAADDLLGERTVETMLAGLSTRRHRACLEPTGTDDRSVSKSAVSRRFVARTRRSLAELLARPLPDDLLVLIDTAMRIVAQQQERLDQLREAQDRGTRSRRARAQEPSLVEARSAPRTRDSGHPPPERASARRREARATAPTRRAAIPVSRTRTRARRARTVVAARAAAAAPGARTAWTRARVVSLPNFRARPRAGKPKIRTRRCST